MGLYEDETILTALARNAVKLADRTSLVFGDTAYTWGELDEITDRAAAELLRKGVTRGERVGMQIIGGLGVVAILAIIKAGAAYVPLNPVFPKDRLDYMRESAGVKFTLRDEDVLKLTAAEKGELPDDIAGTDLYAVMYTSGSTGTPKAISLTHRDAIPYALHYIKTAGFTFNDRMTLYVGFSFVVHIMDLYAWILSGTALHVLPVDIKLDIRKIEEYINKHSITMASFPTGIGKRFLTNSAVPGLKAISLAGEKLTPFTSANMDLRVFNAYGCTECAGAVTVGEVCPESDDVHVGKGADGLILHIVDENGNPVPDGAEGELWVDMPDRRHKTGDLAKRNKDGNIIIVGRKDFQLSVRGYRVEPGEIEICLLKVPDIIEVVAVTRGERLVAYYAANTVKKPQTLKDHLSQFLPPYMIPAVFIHLDKLPRNPNGKIDRAALPEPVYATAGGETPRNGTEKSLAALWGNVLDLSRSELSRDDRFEDLGGDSLSLVMLSVEIEEAFHMTVTPAELWEAGTLEKQAAMIENAKSYSPIFTFQADGKKEPLFFVHSANTGPEAYVKFANLLPKDRPFYAFEHRNLTLGKDLSIRELARIYTDEMLLQYPGRRYALGGWSLGGLISFEMALILERMGNPPAHVYLIDPQICGDEECELCIQLDSSPFYREYLQSEPLFTRFNDKGRLDRLIANNAFLTQEASRYKPQGVLHCPVTLFRMTLQDNANNTNPDEQTLLSRLWDLRKSDSGFGEFTDRLKIINIADTHDRVVVDENSMMIIVNEIMNDSFEG